MEEQKPFLTMEESREGLKQLAHDIKTVVVNEPEGTKFKFIDIIKIFLVCVVAGFGIALGIKIITGALGGF